MTPRYITMQCVQSSLRQTATLLRLHSHIRVAAFSTPEPGQGKSAPIASDSEFCSGKGKIAHGLLIGSPSDREVPKC